MKKLTLLLIGLLAFAGSVMAVDLPIKIDTDTSQVVLPADTTIDFDGLTVDFGTATVTLPADVLRDDDVGVQCKLMMLVLNGSTDWTLRMKPHSKRV
jgi:hypothetical protein